MIRKLAPGAAAVLFAGLAQTGENGYVAAESCRPCHAEIHARYGKTGMSRTFAPIGAAAGMEDWTAKFTHGLSGREYAVFRRDGRFFMKRTRPEPMEREIHYVVGSGNHARTYLTRKKNGKLAELPLSWYAEGGGHWGMSPGYDRADHSEFRREVGDSCLFCHNAYPAEANGGLGHGIDCQRCHGPGAAHAGGRGPIVNPAKLSLERQAEICLQCHLESASRRIPESIRRFERGPYSYRPGEPLGDFQIYFDARGGAKRDGVTVNGSAYGLRQSACFRKSEGRLRCTSCHDAHGKERTAAEYSQACRECHAGTHREGRRGECADCHMAKRRAEDAVHVKVTDHFIRRRAGGGDDGAVEERHGRYMGPVELLYPTEVTEKLYLAAAGLNDKARLPRAVAELEREIGKARPENANWYLRLAQGFREMGERRKAERYYREALGRRPFLAAAATELAELLGPGEAIGMLEGLGASASAEPALLNALAVSYGRAGRFAAAEPLLRRAIDLDEDAPVSWYNLGVCLQGLGRGPAAALAYREALRLQPDMAEARRALR